MVDIMKMTARNQSMKQKSSAWSLHKKLSENIFGDHSYLSYISSFGFSRMNFFSGYAERTSSCCCLLWETF